MFVWNFAITSYIVAHHRSLWTLHLRVFDSDCNLRGLPPAACRLPPAAACAAVEQRTHPPAGMTYFSFNKEENWSDMGEGRVGYLNECLNDWMTEWLNLIFDWDRWLIIDWNGEIWSAALQQHFASIKRAYQKYYLYFNSYYSNMLHLLLNR